MGLICLSRIDEDTHLRLQGLAEMCESQRVGSREPVVTLLRGGIDNNLAPRSRKCFCGGSRLVSLCRRRADILCQQTSRRRGQQEFTAVYCHSRGLYHICLFGQINKRL